MSDGADSWAGHMPEELVVKFVAARKRVRKVILAKGWALILLAACACFGVSIVLDRLFFLGSRYRAALFAACVAAMFVVTVRFLVVPLARRISARRIARSVEDKHPELGDMLLSAVELSEQLAGGEKYTSGELMAAVSRETVKKTKRIDFRSVVPFSTIRKALVVTLVVVFAVGGYCYFRPMIAANVLERLLYPSSGPPPLTFTQLELHVYESREGTLRELPLRNALVPTGADAEIYGITWGKVPTKAYLYVKGNNGEWDKKRLRRENEREFRYSLKGLLGPLSYRMRAGDARSDTYTISVSETPVIVGIEVDYTYPEYTQRPPETKSEGGDITAIKGSTVQITARSNKVLRSAKLRFGDGTESLVSIRDTVIRSQALEVKKDEVYSFDLEDTDGFSNSEAIEYKIRAVEDKAPTVGITKPDRYSEATPEDILPVGFRAVDDFGVEKMWLEYTVKSEEPKEEKDRVASDERKGVLGIALPEGGKTEVEGEYTWVLEEIKARVGEVVVFRIVAEDNNVLSGPGKGSSPEHRIRIISDEASFRKIEAEQQDLTRRLLRLVKQQKDNKKLVDELKENLKGKANPSEAEKGRLEEAKSAQKGIEEAGVQLSKDFSTTLEKMRSNPLIEMRTVIEMAEVTRALGGVSQEEMPEATKKAAEAAKSEDENRRNIRLVETSVLQEKIIKALEEVGQEFAKLQEEQRLLSLAEAASRLAKEQLAARAETAKALPALSGLFPEKLSEEQKRMLKKLVEAEEKLKEKLSEFEDRLRTLKKQSEYANSRDAKMMESALEYFEQGAQADAANIPSDVKQAIDELRANRLHKGMNFQSRVYESLMKLAKEFQDAQTARLQGQFANTAQGLEPYEPEIDKLIEIQKAILAETEGLGAGTEEKPIEAAERGKYEKVSASQKDLLRRTSNFRAILQEILENLVLVGIDPVEPLKGAEKAMGEATGNLDKLTKEDAVSEEKDSLKNLELARDELAKVLAKMMASASLQQAMQAMSALEKMILEQKKVNDGTTNLDKEATEKKEMTDSMLEMLRQLVNQQSGLRDRAMGMQDYLKMMAKAGEMMGQSAEKLNNKQTGQQTQQLQGQILELLMQMLVKLQADMSGMAQAMGLGGTSGTGAHGGIVTPPILRSLPGNVDDRWANLPPRVKQELLEAWTEKFPPEFRELIALYYKRLSGEVGKETK